MTNRQTERTPHEFAGQQEAKALVEWLDDAEPQGIGGEKDESPAEARTRKRIAQLVQDLNRSAETYIREGKPDTALTEKIDEELSRYALRIKTFQVQDEGKHKTFAEPKWIFGWYSSAGARAAEMIFRIVRLGERGLLARVRKCTRCERWFYAKFNHQRFCGKKCQLQHYQTSEEWKQRRRERYRNRDE
jgi:hypothetical protein